MLVIERELLSFNDLLSFREDDPNEEKFLLPLYLPMELPNESIDPFANTFADVYLELDELSFKLAISDKISYIPWRSFSRVLKNAGFPSFEWLIVEELDLYLPVLE